MHSQVHRCTTFCIYRHLSSLAYVLPRGVIIILPYVQLYILDVPSLSLSAIGQWCMSFARSLIEIWVLHVQACKTINDLNNNYSKGVMVMLVLGTIIHDV